MIVDETQLLTFLRSFALAEPVAVPLRVVEATERTPRGPPGPPLPALDFSGAGTLSRDEFLSKLKKEIYPGSGHHRAGALSAEAMRLLAANPGRLLAFDRLREVLGLATGNELLLLTPVSALCPLHGPHCKHGQVLLFNDSSLRGLQQHLRLAHVDEPRAMQLLTRLEYALAHPYCSSAELAARAAPFELLPTDRQPEGRRDLLLRPPPRQLHWVAGWLNVLMTEPRIAGGEPFLTPRHVLVQMIIFLLFLVFPAAAAHTWQVQLPHLFHYAGALLYICKEMGFRLARGRVLFAKGRPCEVLYPIAEWWVVVGGEEGLLVAEVEEHRPWMVRFGELGTVLCCENVPEVRLAIHRRVVAPSADGRLQLELRVIAGSILRLPTTGLKLRRERKVDCNDINIPLPSPVVLHAAELPARHTSGPNYQVIAAFLEIAPSISPPPPMLRGEGCIVVLVSQKFDKRPLNQCGYAHVCHDSNGVPSAQLLGLYEKADDGTLTMFTAARCEELVTEGPAAYRRALSKAVYVSDVEETSTNTLDLALTLNTHTDYTTAGGKHDVIMARLKERRQQLSACLACILAGYPEGCNKPSLLEPCSRCATQSICCTSLHSVFDASDAASEQHKAVNTLNDQSDAAALPISHSQYQRCGVVALHMLKNKIAGFCNYSMVNSASADGGELCISMLRAIACGADQRLAARLVEVCTYPAPETHRTLTPTVHHRTHRTLAPWLDGPQLGHCFAGDGQRCAHLQGQALRRALMAALPAGSAGGADRGRHG